MKPHVRAAAAAAAISHATGKRISSVYDYSQSGYVNTDASADGNRISGELSGNMPSLYHYGESCHVDLKPKGNGKYDGYDYGSSCHFEVTVRGKNADLYDYGDSGFFSFSG